MPMLPVPPVPQELREMLKDYPDHIEDLQQSLNRLVEKPKRGIPPFEQALWLLEAKLGTFMSEARVEIKAAVAIGDAQAIADAKEKKSVMGSARLDMGSLGDLRSYFETHREAFQ